MTHIANLLLVLITAAALQTLAMLLTNHTVDVALPAWLFDQFGFDFGNFIAELATYLLPWLILSAVVTIPLVTFTKAFATTAGMLVFICLIGLDYVGPQQLDIVSDSIWHSIPTLLAWACPIITCWLHRLWLKS
ncbi:hypothetical protein GCM10011369_09810 [Neiella marina]|uniref:Uncharacterized protein n=1 Tax=Neiella marina TaxID=508461 RepID=A0A8J2U3D8_9GAMM|nr:hypothetical protein [Neiella marina]GGA70143.1 hypothetical protein GCM10011369_09810 [Neiella marina]